MFASIAAPPAKQSVGETIAVLSGRLSSATLLEDRRAAILGLRSFAKAYPASVASGALRSLIGSLDKDGEDVDTVKVALETLLMLFHPDADSAEASDEIALWLADEFTQRRENTALLLALLETPDFYARLYALQLLTAILAARPDRTEECVLTAPLGVSRLAALLDDPRDAVRDAALTLLTYLTPASADLQQLVAFEGAFERLLRIVDDEGGVADGGRVTEDCLLLLANLLRGHAANQTLFRESLGTAHLARLLRDVARPDRPPDTALAAWAVAQRNRNLYALLAVIRLFVVPGAAATAQNQADLWRQGVLYQALQLAFAGSLDMSIRAEALSTCAAIIRGNATLQENFAQLRMPAPLAVDDGSAAPSSTPAPLPPTSTTPKPPASPSSGSTNAAAAAAAAAPPSAEVYVIDGLLDLMLNTHAAAAFDVRMAACACLTAYFYEHEAVRLHFLQRAIDGHAAGGEEAANVLTALLRPPAPPAPDPYRLWFAAVILLHLVHDNLRAKALVMAVTEGDEAHGEEVVTSIQTIAAHLLSSAQRGDDARVVIGYLMLLLGWLFEDLEGVNDLLGEGSNVQGLIDVAVAARRGRGGGNGSVGGAGGAGGAGDTSGAADDDMTTTVIVPGLAALLLGVLYEFSTKDSPVPRATLHGLLLERLGRERYGQRLQGLRACGALRDFEVLPQKRDPQAEARLPAVVFDGVFVDFVKDNYSRLRRALDRDPGLEISVVANGVQQGISRELVDALRADLADRDRALRAAHERIATLENAVGEARADHRRAEAAVVAGRDEARAAQEALAQKHEEATRLARAEFQKSRADLQRQMDQAQKVAEQETARVQRRLEAQIADLRATNSRLEVDLLKAQKQKTQELQAAQDAFKKQLAAADATAADARRAAKDLEGQLAAAGIQTAELHEALEAADEDAQRLRDKLKAAEAGAKQTAEALDKARDDKKATQTELDDLLMVFADLEEKAAGYKTRLKALGETISDDEDGDEDEDDEEDAVD